jgi:hypothetical protein
MADISIYPLAGASERGNLYPVRTYSNVQVVSISPGQAFTMMKFVKDGKEVTVRTSLAYLIEEYLMEE